jgi:uncharacterized phage protein (TIGR02218 family)
VGQLSAERRESGLRTGNQEVRGIVDGIQFLAEDLLADRYRGARLVQRIVPWDMPWMVHRSATKTVRQIKYDGSQWIATVEGIGARLQRPVGGVFGGTTNVKCPHVLGDPNTCRADLLADTITGVAVQTVVDSLMEAQFTVASWGGPNSATDDYYRDGEVAWTSGDNAGTVSRIAGYIGSTRDCKFLFPTKFPVQVGDVGVAKPGCDGLKPTCISKFRTFFQSGQSTGSNTTTTLNDTTQSWVTDEHFGRSVRIYAGTGSVQTVNIVSNTATQLVTTPAWSPTPDSTSLYAIISGAGGNVLNFGGVDVYAPGAGKVLEAAP